MARKRKPSREKKINPTFFVFCEGKTEESYVKYLKSKYRFASIQIDCDQPGQSITPSHIEKYKKDKPTHEKDEDFLLYDGDVEVVLNRLDEISATKLISNPSIELWFKLHIKEHTAHTNTATLKKELKEDLKYKEGSINEALKNHLQNGEKEAVVRAKKLKVPENPSTTVYKLIDRLERAKKY
jgi:hypothetical protein